jgi:undecaprenyl-diphosphatase
VHVFRHVTETSFPSGHVVTYTAFFGFLWFMAYTVLKHSWQRTALLFLLGGLVVLVGPSRIYLGEHWFSDVIGAYLLGSLWLSLSIYLYRWGKPRFFANQPLAPPRQASQT